MRKLFVIILGCVVPALQAATPALTSITSGSTVTISTAKLHWEFPAVRRGGKLIVRPDLPYVSGSQRPTKHGSPDLPYLTTLVALPNGETPAIEILDQQSTLRPVENLAFVDTSKKKTAVFPQSAASAFQPQVIAEVGSSAIFRGLHVVRLNVYPVQYNNATHQLRVYSSIRIAVHAKGTVATAQSIARKESKSWDAFAAPLIVNYRDAQRWRTSPSVKPSAPRRTLSAASSRIKIFVRHNGIYRITGHDLAADSLLGGTLGSINPNTFHLYHFHPDTTELPIRLTGASDGRFDENDTLEFAGTMHYGEEGDYFDDYSDDNVYWLLWDDPSPQKLYSPSVSLLSTPIREFTIPEHFEKDIEYYQGDHTVDETTVLVSGKVPGERFYWTYIDPTSVPVFTYPFIIGGIPDDASQATLRVHLRGVTSDTPFPDHDLTIELNGTKLADVPMTSWEDTMVTMTLPSKSFMNGLNSIVIRSRQVAAIVDQVAIDYIEITTPRQPVFVGDSTYLALPPGMAMFTLQDAHSPKLSILDPVASTIPLQTALLGGTFVRVESRGSSENRYVRFEVSDSSVYEGPYYRGINVAVIDQVTGRLIDVQNFDTYGTATASSKLANYCAGIAKGNFVMMAVCDEGSRLLNDTARAAIRALGSTKIDQLGSADSWAFVGRAGDATFTPVEDFSRSGTGGAHVTATVPTTAVHSWALTFLDSARNGSVVVAQTLTSVATPRMKLRHTTSLRDPSHRADYIVISHASLISEARRLAAFRAQHDHLDTAVVDVEDIYDEFNGGIESEVPIRDFLATAYATWQAPAPSLVVLFGDASWDPKFNTRNAWRKNLVPTYGKPVSDYWFTLLEGDDMLPEMMCGRIAVPTLDTAQAVVQKIIDYATQGPHRWNKEFMFIAGGTDPLEGYFFQNAVGVDVPKVIAPPICGHSTLIARDDFTGFLDQTKTRIIDSAINSGILWITYLGHAAANLFEVTIDSASVLQNQGRLPFFSAFSCQTGAFAEPQIISANESYFNQPEKGFIGTWGITGFGDVAVDEELMNDIYSLFADSSGRQLGALTTQSKVMLWNSNLSSNITAKQNTIMQYSLLGDPATVLSFGTCPDAEITDSDIVVVPGSGSGNIISDQDTSFLLKFAVYNNGTTSNDTFRVLVHDAFPAGSRDTSFTMFMPCRVDSAALLIPVRGASGEHQLTITLDPNNTLPCENDKSNNVAHHTVYVYSSVLTVLRPRENGSLAGACKPNTIAVLVPQVGANALQYFFEIDSTQEFSHPVQSAALAAPSGPDIEWTIPFTPANNVVYYWRVRTLNPATNLFSQWVTANFIANERTWEQRSAAQFKSDAITAVTIQTDGVHLGVDREFIQVTSRGFSNPLGPGMQVVIGNGNPTPITDTRDRGIYVFVLSDTAAVLDYSGRFDTFASDSDSLTSRQLVDFINAIPGGRTVIVAAADEASLGLSSPARDALRLLGANLSDSIQFRSSYALIGRKGAVPGTVPEQVRSEFAGTAFLADTIAFQYLRGVVTSPPIGPASAWDKASASFRLPSQLASGYVTVYGVRRDGHWDSLAAVTPTSGPVDLSFINPVIYRTVRIVAQLFRNDVSVEPVLQSWGVSHADVPELLTYAPSVSIAPDSVMEGETPRFDGDIYNTGCATAHRVNVRVTLQSPGVSLTAATTVIDSIMPGAFVHWTAALATAGARGVQTVLVTVDPADSISELVETNNTILSSLLVRKDTTAPTLTVTVDGRQILNHDVVSPNPEIIVKMFDASPLPLRDLQCIVVRIDTVTYSAVRTPSQMTTDTAASGGVRARSVLHPATLGPGSHEMRVFGTDATGNVDSSYDRIFEVDSASSLEHVINAPNPFARETYFTFLLHGLVAPTSAKVKIYSVAGRLLRVIDVPPTQLRIGFNTIPWDGLDEDGDRLANGVYLYKVIVHLSGQDLIETSRLAVLR